MTSTIMLAKPFDIDHVTFPCVLLEKLDGVAARFDCNKDGTIKILSRQNKDIPAAYHIAQELERLLHPGDHVVGELYIPGKSFKEISGISRRYEASEELFLYIYDYWLDGSEGDSYNTRMKTLVSRLKEAVVRFTFKRVKLIPVQHVCGSEFDINNFKDAFWTIHPDAEGLVLRNLNDSPYCIGKRSWDMQKLKFKNTVDLEVISVEEAVSKDGVPMGMIGRINCMYQRQLIGVGPGALTHLERYKYYRNQELFVGKIIEVEYMPDANYTALREPRFKRLRDDKSEPNEESNEE